MKGAAALFRVWFREQRQRTDTLDNPIPQFVSGSTVPDGREGCFGKQPQPCTMVGEHRRSELGLRKEKTKIAVAHCVLDIGEMPHPFYRQLSSQDGLDPRSDRRLVEWNRSMQVGIGKGNCLRPGLDRERHNLLG